MVVSKSISRTHTVRAQVGQVLLRLRHIQSAAVVAVAALKQQNCELDMDIANVLQRSVTDGLQDQIEKLEITVRLASSLDRKPKKVN
jgi:hypothetical protein